MAGLSSGGDAALIRVQTGPAQVLVTIYQPVGSATESAPKLRVLWLSDAVAPEGAAAGAVPAVTGVRRPVMVLTEPHDIIAHVQRIGDTGRSFGEWVGTPGSQMAIEGFSLMGTLAQYGHRTGIRPDHAMSTHERDEKAAAERLAAEEQKRTEQLTALPELQRGENEALEAVRPLAEAKLAQLQERAALARDVQQEKMEEQRGRNQARARERGRDRGDQGFER